MLTPTDIQYVVGLLSLAATPEKVEVELGSMVYDVASQSVRDVDVTLRVEDRERRLTGYKGIEVKDHKRRLGSEHVEQLAAKLNDMPALSHRAIVSASGYTRPSIRKAEAKGIQLLELRDWGDRAATFSHFGVELVPACVRALNWIEHLHVTFSAAGEQRGVYLPVDVSTPVRFAGAANPACPDVGTLTRNLQINAINSIKEMKEVEALPNSEPTSMRVVVQISDRPCIVAAGKDILVESATLTGKVEWSQLQHDTIYKILVPLGGGAPLAGCAVSEIPGLGLCGLMLAADRKLSFVRIPVSERNRNKIYRRPITQQLSSSLDVAS
jgi:hypothetical protein